LLRRNRKVEIERCSSKSNRLLSDSMPAYPDEVDYPRDISPDAIEVAGSVPNEEKDSFFNEELRTRSAEEYQTLRRELEGLRHQCEELLAAQQIVHEELEEADHVLGERAMLIEAMRSLVQNHPELLED